MSGVQNQTKRIEPVCDHCGKTAAQASALVAMMPGKDGIEWYLCGRCWEEGRQPFILGMFKKPTVITDPALYDALVAASPHTPGLNDVTPPADRPKRAPKKRSPS